MEDSKEYAWKRFWAPRDDNVHLHLEDGFLPNPKEPYSHIRNLSVISFESIDKIPCLILLGEPGIGKSIWMEREIRNRKKAAIQNNSIVLHFNLNTITESNLVDKIFNNIEFKKWENSDSYLELFIDSFDEGRLRVNHIADILLEEFMSISLEIQRLKLRITCRGADWPDYFENNFESLWAIPYMNKSLEPKLGEINEIKDNTEKLDEFHDTDISSSSDISLEDNKGGEKKTDKHKLAVYSMMPLRLEDIKIALLSEKINKNEFLEELERCDAFSLASHPDTFKMLINLYREHGGKLPDNKVEIHNEGLLLKCEETNISRKASGDIGKYEPEVRRDIASFIASMTLLSNRQNISFDRVSSINASSDIYARLMIAELNFSNSSIQIVDSNNINDTIKYSKLFTPSGTNCFRFNQRTHWEFLTARFLNLSNLSLEQRLKLLTNRVDDQIKIVPQLAEVASWLASMDRDFFNILLELEPKIILRSDVGTIKRNRYQLLKKLLEEFANGNLTDPDYSLRHHYKKLNCEGIGNLLAKYLEDITQGIEVRLQAIFIADACKVVDIQELLATIVFDKDQHKYLRERSATVLSRIGDTKTRGKLKPLLADTEEEELKGYLLMSLWDDHVNIEEVLTCVTLKKQSEVNIENEYPSNSVIGGGFDIFFRFDFLQKVKIDDFPILLEWIDDVVDVYWVTSTIETLISDAYKMIIKNARKIIIRKALIKSIIHRIDTHKDPIPTDSIDKYPIPYFENDEDRRTILKDMIAYFSTDQKNKYNYRWFSLERSPLCDPEDAEWIIEQIKCVKEISIRETWSKLLFHVFINKKMSGKQISKILEAIEEFKELKEQFKNHIGVKEINSKEAIEWRKHNSITPKYTKKKLDPQALVISELKQLEDGEIGIWWHINKLMTLIPDSNYYGDFTNPDLTSLPVWINADSKLRKRILNAAKKYLEKANNNVENWVGTNKFNRNDLAAYRAIRLLFKCKYVISKELWKKWTPVVCSFPFTNSDNLIDQQIVKNAFHFASQSALKIVTLWLRNDCRDSSSLNVTKMLVKLNDNVINATLLTVLQDKNLDGLCSYWLLELLIENDFEMAIRYATSSLVDPIRKDDIEKAIIAAKTLLFNCSDRGWDSIWKAINKDRGFGEKLFLHLATDLIFSKEISPPLNEENLANLFIWLEEQFPHDEDPKFSAGQPSARDDIASLRGNLLQQLRSLSTLEALKEHRRIEEKFPRYEWLRRNYTLLRDEYLRKNWMPNDPDSLKNLFLDSSRHIIENGNDLLDLIKISLCSLQDKLNGHIPMARFLWDKVPNKQGEKEYYRPVEEPTFSDFVAQHLKEDLIDKAVVINREVEVERGSSKGVGQRTDIHVDAILKESGYVICSAKVIVDL